MTRHARGLLARNERTGRFNDIPQHIRFTRWPAPVSDVISSRHLLVLNLNATSCYRVQLHLSILCISIDLHKYFHKSCCLARLLILRGADTVHQTAISTSGPLFPFRWCGSVAMEADLATTAKTLGNGIALFPLKMRLIYKSILVLRNEGPVLADCITYAATRP